MNIAPVGERSLLVSPSEGAAGVHALWRALSTPPIPGVVDVVAGAGTVLVIAGPSPSSSSTLPSWSCEMDRIREEVAARSHRAPPPGDPRTVVIPVTYGGPDLAAVAELCGMSEEEVIRRHSGATYTVAFVGFSPGFGYLAGGDPALHVPRLATPRTTVPAGSVAIAGDMTAVYPQSTPGGWRLIGHTRAIMFDPQRAEPALLAPGDRVRFEAATGAWPSGRGTASSGAGAALGGPGPALSRAGGGVTPHMRPARVSAWEHLRAEICALLANVPRIRRWGANFVHICQNHSHFVEGYGGAPPEPGRAEVAPAGSEAGPTPAGSEQAATAVASVAYVDVLDPGPLTTVQDLGRTGWAHVGVPAGGALDRGAAVRANRLVGNPDGAAVLESTLAGPHFRVGIGCRVAVCGAVASVVVDGLPARQEVALELPPGAEVAVGPYDHGARVCVAFSGGGIAVPTVLGSRSTDTLSGLGPAPVGAGDRLALGAATGPPVGGPVPAAGARPAGGPGLAGGAGSAVDRGPADGRGSPGGPGLSGSAGSAGDPGPAGRTPAARTPAERPAAMRPIPEGAIDVTARLGPRADWLTPAGVDNLGSAEFVVGTASDRTGLRLNGPAVPLARDAQLPSEGLVPGAIEVPPDGQPIVLLRNHPTTGGYPVVAVVDDAGVDALAQARPGDVVRFRLRS